MKIKLNTTTNTATAAEKRLVKIISADRMAVRLRRLVSIPAARLRVADTIRKAA